MARKPRVEFAGATYHVMCRGNRQETIYIDKRDHECFLNTLEDVVQRTGWLIHAYVLMSNHYHILLETPEPNLVIGMRWLQSTYTQRFNARHQVLGHLFQGRYKALPVEAGLYFRTVADYIHLNPVRAHAFNLESGHLSDFRWSSYCGYVRLKRRPSWLIVDRVLAAHGMKDDSPGRSRYREYMKRRVVGIQRCKNPREADEQWRKIRRGWAFGSEEFHLKIQEAIDCTVSGKRRDSFMGEEIQRHDEKEAENMLQQGLKCFGIKEDELKTLRKGDDRKKVMAWLIRNQCAVQAEWITRRLKMGSRANLSRYIRVVDQSKDDHLWKLKNKLMKYAD